MRAGWRSLFGVMTCLCLLGCPDRDVLPPSGPSIVVDEITVEELPSQFDESRIYFSGSPVVEHPEALLRQMWARGIRPVRAWNPLPPHDLPCMQVMPGPRFTVELEVDDPRVLEYGFARGSHGLTCSLRYDRYTVLDGAAL